MIEIVKQEKPNAFSFHFTKFGDLSLSNLLNFRRLYSLDDLKLIEGVTRDGNRLTFEGNLIISQDFEMLSIPDNFELFVRGCCFIFDLKKSDMGKVRIRATENVSFTNCPELSQLPDIQTEADVLIRMDTCPKIEFGNIETLRKGVKRLFVCKDGEDNQAYTLNNEGILVYTPLGQAKNGAPDNDVPL